MKPHSVLYTIPLAVLAFWLGHLHGAGPLVHVPIPAPVPAAPTVIEVPSDCTDAVGIAVAATEDRCTKFLDCRNVWLHPDKCSADCKYHALNRASAFEAAFGPSDTDPEWGPYAEEVDHWQPSDGPAQR